MESIDANKVLPQNLIIKSAENKLLSIGLIYRTNNKSNIFNGILYNTLFISTIITIVTTKLFVSLIFSEENDKIFIILGDFSYFLGIRIYGNTASGLYYTLALISQIIYYYNYKNDIKPTFLRVFEMMSGLVSPKSIGLTNKQQIYRMIKITKLTIFIYKNFIEKIIITTALFENTIPFINHCSILEFIIFVIPNCLLYTISAYYMISIIFWQSITFPIICYYIRIKIKQTNENIRKVTRNRKRINNIKIKNILRSMNSLYSEVNDYNTSFLSKYLLLNWFIFGLIMNTLLFSILFEEMNSLIKVLFLLALIFCLTIFMFIINMSSLVNFEANKSYKLLNTLLVCYNNSLSKSRLFHYISVKFKVNFI
jgi:hypothetical protein